jgi:hypothetical protein
MEKSNKKSHSARLDGRLKNNTIYYNLILYIFQIKQRWLLSQSSKGGDMVARPKKQTVEYFPHFVASGKTLYILEQAYGNDGYAFWFKILELLGSTDGHSYDCKSTPAWKFLLAKTKVNEDVANMMLDMLAELEAIDRQMWTEKIIWCDKFVENLLPLYTNRKSSLPHKPVSTSRNINTGEFLLVETPPSEVSTHKNTQSKVEESKVEESKVEEVDITATTEEALPDYIKILEHFNDRANKIQNSTKEIELSRKLISDGISVKIAILGIDEAFTNYKPDGNHNKISTLIYCEGKIRDLWKAEQEVQDGGKVTDTSNRNNSRLSNQNKKTNARQQEQFDTSKIGYKSTGEKIDDSDLL